MIAIVLDFPFPAVDRNYVRWLRSDWPGRAAHGSALLAGGDRRDRPRRQPAEGGTSVRRDAHIDNSADCKAAAAVLALTGARGVPARLITHRFRLDQIIEAYDTFGRAADAKALEVITGA